MVRVQEEKQASKQTEGRGKTDCVHTHTTGNKPKLWGKAEIQRFLDKIPSKLKLERISQISQYRKAQKKKQ